MLHKLQKSKNDGFTIIEVMIVLAIAGLIMLIVFLAVPALQRNAHNTSIKNDVGNVLASVNEFVNNNNGTAPTTVTIADNTVTVSGADGTNKATNKVGYLTAGGDIGTTIPTSPPDLGTITIVKHAVCNDAGTAATADNATDRNFAAVFQLEGGAKECQQS